MDCILIHLNNMDTNILVTHMSVFRVRRALQILLDSSYPSCWCRAEHAFSEYMFDSIINTLHFNYTLYIINVRTHKHSWRDVLVSIIKGRSKEWAIQT
jgi:hypothetical protein